MTWPAALLVASIVAALAYLALVAAGAVFFALRLGGRREDPIDNRDVLSSSRFTIPVSVIVPLTPIADGSIADGHHDERSLHATIASIAGLNYPELEVIVVAEELPAGTWASLKREWALEPREYFYRQTLATGPVRMVYRSAREPRLIVVDKTLATSRADAVNCGVNLARFRYVTAVTAGIVFDAEALLRAMAVPLRDPAAIVGASSHVEVASGIAAVQTLVSIRSLMGSRMAWRTPQAVLVGDDTVVVWRRDAIVQLGGFSTSAADPELDMTIRVQTSPQISGRVVRSAEIFGQMKARSGAARNRRTARHQVAALQAARLLWVAGAAARRSLAYVFMSDVLTPLAQVWAVAGTIAGAAAGWVGWRDAVLVVVLVSFGRAVVSAAALLLRGSAVGAPETSDVQRLLLVAPLELVMAGPAALRARAAGVWAVITRS